MDGIEYNGSYGDPAQGSDPRDNNTDGDHLDDGDEDLNGNGVIDTGETDPTRINDEGDFDGDGLQNWEENNSCTFGTSLIRMEGDKRWRRRLPRTDRSMHLDI